MLLLLGASVLSLSAQIAVAKPSPSGWLLSAVPALAFIGLSKLVFTGAISVDSEPAESVVTLDELESGTEEYTEPDPWRHALPIEATGQVPPGPATERATSAVVAEYGNNPDGASESPRAPAAARRVRPRALTSASNVEAAAAKLPADATLAEIAAEAGVSESTVRRYLPRPAMAG